MEKINFSQLQGFYNNISNKDYHDDRHFISSSGLKLMYKNPRLFYKSYVENSEPSGKNSPNLDFGSYIHSLILEPELTEKEFAIFDEGMRRGKKWEEFLENNKDKTIISGSQHKDAMQLFDSYRNAKVLVGDAHNESEIPVSSFITNGIAEQSLFDQNFHGISTKVRFDYRREFESFGEIYDIKTTSEHIDDIEKVREICNLWSYEISAAMYVDMATKATGKPHDFYFIFLSKASGACQIFKASDSMLDLGREKYLIGIEKLKQARETNIYFRNTIQVL